MVFRRWVCGSSVIVKNHVGAICGFRFGRCFRRSAFYRNTKRKVSDDRGDYCGSGKRYVELLFNSKDGRNGRGDRDCRFRIFSDGNACGFCNKKPISFDIKSNRIMLEVCRFRRSYVCTHLLFESVHGILCMELFAHYVRRRECICRRAIAFKR